MVLIFLLLSSGHQIGTDVDSGARKEVFSRTAEICSVCICIASDGKKGLALLWLKLIIKSYLLNLNE